jgi:hypothetical protein
MMLAHTLEQSEGSPRKINFKTVTVTSLIAGFFLIPFHEFGHVVCDWVTGHPAAMSYARDYLLSGGETPFLGLLGGPLFPLILSTIAVILIYRGIRLSVSYPLAVLGTMDRLLLYLAGSTPSDERDLARAMAWPAVTFKYIFLGAEIFLLVLVLRSLIRYKVGIKRGGLILVIPVASFVISASLGVFVVDRFVFPEQHKKEFGLTLPRCSIDSSRRVRGLAYLAAFGYSRTPSRK